MMRLINELALYEKAPNEVVATEQTLLSHGFGANRLFVSWVAELDGQVIGMALCYIRYSTWKGPIMYLEDLVVTESHRSKGIGKLLFEKCLDYAKTQGYPRMIWQVLDWNQPAIEFYKQYQASFDAQWLNAYIDF